MRCDEIQRACSGFFKCLKCNVMAINVIMSVYVLCTFKLAFLPQFAKLAT